MKRAGEILFVGFVLYMVGRLMGELGTVTCQNPYRVMDVETIFTVMAVFGLCYVLGWMSGKEE